MHISEIQLTEFKSFKTTVKIENFSKNINIIVGKNGSGKSNIIAAFSTILNPSKILSVQKQALINESNAINQNKAIIEIKISENDRFPFKESFSLRREFEPKKDTYYIAEDKGLSKIEDSAAMFESANITNNAYYVIQQGKINHFALMNDLERLELIKEIAGANIYEKDRKHCKELLLDTERSNEKTLEMLKTINQKLAMLQKEKAKLIELENLENKKHEVEIAIYKKEKEQVEYEIERLNKGENVIENEIIDINEVQDEIMYCKKQIEDLKYSPNAYLSNNFDTKTAITEKATLEIKKKSCENDYNELVKRQQGLEMSAKGTQTALEVNKGKLVYFNMLLSTKEFLDYTQEFEKQAKALEEHTKMEKFINSKSKIDIYKELQNSIFERNKLWSDEKKTKEKRQSTYSDYLRLERNLAYIGGGKYKEYCDIKNSPGVHGCVFELLNIPDELFSAFETVAGNSLFNVVVDSDDIATELCTKIQCRLTFIPLNRIKGDHTELQIDDAFLLSSKISCKGIYKPILNYVTKNTYITSDIKTGLLISKAHNINVVTVDGEFISKKGFVSGGSERKNNVLKDLKTKEAEIKQLDKKMLEIKSACNAVTLKIDELRKSSTIEIKPLDKNEYLHTLELLKWKNELLRDILNKGWNEKHLLKCMNEIRKQNKHLESKVVNIENESKKINASIVSTKCTKDLLDTKYNELVALCESNKKEQQYIALIDKLDKLKKLEREISEKENGKLYQCPDDNDEKIKKNNIQREVLIEKKLNLLRKIGRNNDNIEYDNLSMGELYSCLKDINEKMKQFSSINKKALVMFEDYFDQKTKLEERLQELQNEKIKIDGFIYDLDNKKTDTVNLTYRMIRDNFSYFFSKLSPNDKAELHLIDDGVSIKINNEIITDIKKLSGGQKALIALSLIFSIQKIDPSPFYFFDEIDAHLDEQSRENVSKLIKEISAIHPCTQFFVVSFRKKMLSVGDKFYCVDYDDNTSTVREVDREEAMYFVGDDNTTFEQ